MSIFDDDNSDLPSRGTGAGLEIPDWVRASLVDVLLAPTEEVDACVERVVPALADRSIRDWLSHPDGERVLREFFRRACGR